jgi:DNA-directed RNA polymerase specialized sigma24 family protein
MTATAPTTAIMTFAEVANLDTARMARYAFGMCRDANMADDIVQQTILGILNRLRKHGEFTVEDINDFLNVGMRNSFRNILKSKKRRRIEHSDNAIESFENATKDTTEIDVFDTLEGITLNKTESRFVQYMLEGMTKLEICDKLEISGDNFWKISQRIRDKVRDSIE